MTRGVRNDGQPKRQPVRTKSRGHPFFTKDRPRGFYYPEAVGVVPGYPKTLETWLERQAIMRQQVKLYNAEGIARRTGVPDGYAGRREDLRRYRKQAAAEAKAVMKGLVKMDLIDHENKDDPRVEQMLQAAVEIVVTKDDAGRYIDGTAVRVAAINTLLKYLKAPPPATNKVVLSKAEDFLAELAKGV